MEEKDKIYAAAIVDSGSYFSFRTGPKGMSPMIRIRRENPDALTDVQKVFGGRLAFSRKSEIWYWAIQGDKLIDFLILIRPYLKTKINHAQLIFEFNRQVERRKKEGTRFKKLTDEERTFREEILARMTELNK